MRNRLNVTWHGKRTTARFPEYLWDLALLATGYSDHYLVNLFHGMASLHDDDSLYRHYSASQFVVDQLVSYIEFEVTPAGFNPGNSRAPGPGQLCDVKTALFPVNASLQDG